MSLPYLSHEELKRVFACAKEHGTREACMFILGYGHALRASEIASLTIHDVKGGRIRCRRGKGSEHTTEDLREHELEALGAWLRERKDGDGSVFLFTSRQGSRLSRQQVYNLFRACAEKAGIPREKSKPHALKHAYASHMIRAGVDLAYVQKAMGHAHISSTVRYTHVSVKEAQQKSDAVLQALSL
jgi:site-specific recombinase XerD